MITIKQGKNRRYHFPLKRGCNMKLKDCDCGGIPEITYSLDDNIEFVVVYTVCGNQTPGCESLREAVTLWNHIYCNAFYSHEMESV